MEFLSQINGASINTSHNREIIALSLFPSHDQVIDYFKRSITDVEMLRDSDYIKETSLDFCKKQKLKEAMMKSVKLLNNSSFGEISTVINDAIKLGADGNYGYDYKKDFEERYMLKARNPVTTGWEKIDAICKGGTGS